MDIQKQCLQQARVAAFIAATIPIVANFSALNDDGPSRLRNPFQQRLLWANFVTRHQNKGILHRHLRMSLSSFQTLLDKIRQDLELDEKMSFLRGGNYPGNSAVRYHSVRSWWVVHRYLCFLWHFGGVILCRCVADHPRH